MSISPSKSLIDFPTVGPTTFKRLKNLNLSSAADLIFYYPYRYEDFSKIYPLNNLPAQGNITVQGKIELLNSRRAWRKKMHLTEVFINDGQGSLKITWFNQPYLSKTLKVGQEITVSGALKNDQYGPHLTNPTYEKKSPSPTHTSRLIPLYALTQGLTQKQLRFLIKYALDNLEKFSDWLPLEIIKKNNLISLDQAYRQIHFPDNPSKLEAALRRLKFNELLILQLYTEKSRQNISQQQAPQIKFQEAAIKKFVNQLPFQLTDDQKKSAWQILQDLNQSKPMNRLLEGDVGSGKTIVAALAMHNTSLNGQQSVLMAPTEILAQQHYQSLKKLLPQAKISLVTRTRKNILDQSQIFVGTHALLEKKVSFSNLGLAIIDEQHRFGVAQRKTLKEKSGNPKTLPHLLSLTATPIPRSLALTLYGDLDLSLIKQKPKGRKPIITKLVTEDKRQKAYQFIKTKIKQGQQVFIICPLISPSDKLGVKSVEEEYQKLNEEIFPELNINFLHGKLKSTAKEKIMNDFKKGKFPILISTSVVEVGVDIPQATIMLIESSERFGLAQLHQFRGRVGRNDLQSYCFLFTDSRQPQTLKRLQALTQNQDGFSLAAQDLQLRGPGQVYGTEQSGFLSYLKLANLNDHLLINETKKVAKDTWPKIDQFPRLKNKLKQFTLSLHLE